MKYYEMLLKRFVKFWEYTNTPTPVYFIWGHLQD